MIKPDDSSLTPKQYARIKVEAERALNNSGTLGRFPTCIEDIMLASNVEEVKEDVLGDSFINKLRLQFGGTEGVLRRAISKVIGLFDAKARLIFVDRKLMEVKQRFVRLHEAAHAFIPWQRDLYNIVEDCEKTIESDLADEFDREANVFASEVLFQLDSFNNEAEQSEFDIFVSIRLSKKYNASIYASIRRYVTYNSRACMVLILNNPILVDGDGFHSSLRRKCSSQLFEELFGNIVWPEIFTPDDEIGMMIPLNGNKSSAKRQISLKDENGELHERIAEAFTQRYQIFVLIHANKTLNKKTFVMPNINIY